MRTNGLPFDSVYNLKRRIAELPPIAADAYAENVATNLVTSKQNSLDAVSSSAAVKPSPKNKHIKQNEESEDDIDEHDRVNCCLFCTKDSETQETNVEHMSSGHSLYIPEIERLSSLDTIIGYLRTVIVEYNECLYCGMVKQSAESIRRHMLDKGHCMINLEREPELLEFWQFSDSDEHDADDEEALKSWTRNSNTTESRDLSEGDYTLPSGKVVGSRSRAREARLSARRTALATKEISDQAVTEGTNENTELITRVNQGESLIGTQGGIQDRAISVRDARGLIGVSDQQIRSLVTVHRKTQRQQAIVRASAKWADELGGTHQKHYKQKMNLRDG